MKISRSFCIPLGWMMKGSAGWAQDNPSLSGLFSDHMVLQRDIPVLVWGTAKPGTKVSVKFGQQEKTAETGKDGRWLVRLDALKASAEPAQLTVKLPAGGWYALKVRFRKSAADPAVLGEAAVAHVGVGDIFVVAGQSNASNHGAEQQKTTTGLVAASDGKRWQLANDPQPGASGDQGSFQPPFGDAMAAKFKVPVGIIACGIGATSVREWLPKGATFPNPPTLEGRVRQLASGEWESKGEAFDMLTGRMKQLGPKGFRAVLWHQGESDADQPDPKRTLIGKPYRVYLEQLITESRKAIGWDAPWFVALVSSHGGDGVPEMRDAQKSLWTDGIALEGPDSDALKGDLRDGVHFSGKGLREHGKCWADKVAPWLERQTGKPTSRK
ncbi:MAG: hypothetical protein NTW21_01850 [Verrucomicrobia bacterium]|nr:hypothetical protein [Verrucomicrobiota bacterium]